jgi:hypothetical protein
MSLYQYNDQPITKKLNEQAKHKSIGREQSSKSLFPQITPPSESQQVGVIRQKSPPPASNLVLTEDSQKARSKKKLDRGNSEAEPHLSLSEAEYLMELRW